MLAAVHFCPLSSLEVSDSVGALLTLVTAVLQESFEISVSLARDPLLHEIKDSRPEHLVTLGFLLGLRSVTRLLVRPVGVREPRCSPKGLDTFLTEPLLPPIPRLCA